MDILRCMEEEIMKKSIKLLLSALLIASFVLGVSCSKKDGGATSAKVENKDKEV